MSGLEAFRRQIEGVAKQAPEDVRRAFRDLSLRYDAGAATRNGRAQALAYAVGRAPGTYAAAERVLSEVARCRPDWTPETLLDVGAGAGSASWAAVDVYPSLRSITLVESSAHMAELGSTLAGASGSEALRQARWIRSDVATAGDLRADLVVASYVLGEIPGEQCASAVKGWFAAAGAELAIVEVGSPRGFGLIRLARQDLIAEGATVTAPCPHDGSCPMKGNDWCHFGVRVPRSRMHQTVKGGQRPYEDEKFSYVVASKQGPVEREPRVVRSPGRRSGHVRLELCTEDGLEEVVVSRRHGDRYRTARKLSWGDSFAG